MLVTSPATCPNPALLGPKLSPIETTPIEPAVESREPSVTTYMAASFIANLGLGAVIGTLYIARTYYLAHKIHSINYPSGSGGAFLQDRVINKIHDPLWAFRPWKLSTYTQRWYAFLTEPRSLNTLNNPLWTELGHFCRSLRRSISVNRIIPATGL